MEPLTFAESLLAQGIELVVRNRRLAVWPAKAYGYLTDAERAFLRQHRDELKALAESRALPETTVAWHPPGTEPEPDAAATPPPPEERCVYCELTVTSCTDINARRPSLWRLLHRHDPLEINRRAAEATAEMYESLRRSGTYR